MDRRVFHNQCQCPATTVILATSPKYETSSPSKAGTSFRRDFSEKRRWNNIEKNALHQSCGNIWLRGRDIFLSFHEIDHILSRSFRFFDGLTRLLRLCEARLYRFSKLAAGVSQLQFDRTRSTAFKSHLRLQFLRFFSLMIPTTIRSLSSSCCSPKRMWCPILCRWVIYASAVHSSLWSRLLKWTRS